MWFMSSRQRIDLLSLEGFSTAAFSGLITIPMGANYDNTQMYDVHSSVGIVLDHRRRFCACKNSSTAAIHTNHTTWGHRCENFVWQRRWFPRRTDGEGCRERHLDGADQRQV